MSKEYGFKVMCRRSGCLQSAIIRPADQVYQCVFYSCGAWSKEPHPLKPLLGWESYEAALTFARANIQEGNIYEIWLMEFEKSDEKPKLWGGPATWGEGVVFCKRIKPIKHLSTVLFMRTVQDTEELEEVEMGKLPVAEPIACGYEWTCGICGYLNKTYEHKETAYCSACGVKTEMEPPEHAIG